MAKKLTLEEWYRRRLYTRCPGPSNRRLFGLLRWLQQRYNALSPVPCRGLKYMRLGAGQYCNRPMCPSCWHRAHVGLVEAFPQIVKLPGYFYLRETWSAHWQKELSPMLLRRFKVRRPGYHMLAYTLNVQASTTNEITEDDRGDEFGGQLSYSLLGLFHSNTPLTEYHMDHAGLVHVWGPDRQLEGVISRDPLEQREVADAWLSRLEHPWTYRFQQLFDQYIQEFRPACLGRTWHRFNRTYLR